MKWKLVFTSQHEESWGAASGDMRRRFVVQAGVLHRWKWKFFGKMGSHFLVSH